jgi:hypothetical protein
LRRSEKRSTLPIAARKVAAAITFTPGTVISRRASGQLSASCASNAIHGRDLGVEKSIWRRPLSSVSRSSIGSSSSADRARPALPTRSLTSGRPLSRLIKSAWISFFTRVRASTSWDRRASRRRITLVRSSGIHTLSSDPAANSSARGQQLGQRPRVQAIGLRPGVTDPRVTR